MILRKKLMQKLYKKYPRSIAKKNHDFVGIMVKPLREEINSIVLCLDLDDEVLKRIENQKVDLIITHHPFLYGRSKVQVLKTNELRRAWTDELIKRGIGVVSMHTNFDEASDGMNDVLASKLGLKNIYAPEKFMMMRIGELETPLSREEFATYAKEKLNVKYALLQSYGKEMISKVGIIGGGGSYGFKVAMEESADIFISGDAPHHIRRDVANYHFNYLDVPHEVERVFMKKMEEVLLNIDPSLNILIVDHEIEATVF